MEKAEEEEVHNDNEEKVSEEDDNKKEEDVDFEKRIVELSNVGDVTGNTMKPVKPKSGFMNYYISLRQLPDSEKPRMTYQARRELGAKWKNLPAEEKDRFLKLTETQKHIYKLQLAEYKKQRVDDETKVKCYASTRCSPYNLFKLFEQLKAQNKEAAIEALGFSGLLHLKGRSLKRDLCDWLVQNFDVTSRSMKLHGKRIPITVDDVCSILGLRNEGIDVPTSGNIEEVDRICESFNLPTKTKLTFGILEHEMLLFDGQSDDFKARLLLYIVGRFLCPTTDWGPSHDYYFCLNEEGLTGKLNWASHVYEKLLDGIKSFRSGKDKSYLTGCVLLLEIKFLDHMSRVWCKSGIFSNSTVLPRIAAWGKEDVGKLFSHVKDFRVPFKVKEKRHGNHNFFERKQEEENIPTHSSLLGIQEEMKSLKEHVKSLTESVTRMSGNMKYMSCMVMSYATTMESLKEFLNASANKSVQVNDHGQTSMPNPNEESPKCDISPKSKSTGFGHRSASNKTDVSQNTYDSTVHQAGADSGNPIPIVSDIIDKDAEFGTAIDLTLKRPTSTCRAPRKKKDITKISLVTIPKEVGMLETSICNYVWNADEDLSEVLIHYGSLFASREELQVLHPKGWLTSTIIDLVSWTLAYDSKFNGLSTTRWYFPASFSGLILVHPPNAEDIIKVFKQQFIRMGSLSDCFKIYIPMNDVNKHWYLCVIDMMDKEARVYDSLPRTKSNLKRINDVNHMISYCSRLFKDSTFTSLVGKPVWELDECKVVVPERVPSQGNGHRKD
ncbi:hypothetical protein REPUB_Repub07fG0096600 [Reevesia pubescens]